MPKSLSRKDNHRRSLLRNLATSLVLYEEIRTTKPKAQEVKAIVEHLIHLAKQDTLVVRRQLLGYFFDGNAVKKMFEVLVPRYKKITSGFIKIYKVGPRLGDNAEMVILKLAPTKEKDAEEKSQPEGGKEEDAPIEKGQKTTAAKGQKTSKN